MAKALLVLFSVIGTFPDDGLLTQDEFVEMCDVKEMVYSGGSKGDQTFQYRLFVPDPMKKGKKYPLILWLHGYGREIGSDNTSQMRYLEFLSWKGEKKSDYPYFILFPQCPKTNPGWYHATNPQDQMATVALAMLEKTKKEYPIDDDRIYLFGISGGGSSALQMLNEHSDLFAAAAVAGAGGCPSSFLPQIAKTPLWAFHGKEDRCPFTGIQEVVEGVRELGGSAALTLYDKTGHHAWECAMQTEDVFGWMLHQKRDNESSWCYPGRPSGRQINVAFQKAKIPLSITFLVFVLTLFVLIYQYRKTSTTNANQTQGEL